ncbi:DUF1829 domain-containing protein [Lactococcus lactis]|uniref:DUF1829 domain-containing protein n=1 Tax=Lactococcus lactis TaxID=1358 RepID=UPI0021A2E4C2|nr:DUF1829 domain-containing protein [Lactococcus lactis]MCT3097625.1 DUF1829 domain-containing protein [Lactococcus lactis]
MIDSNEMEKLKKSYIKFVKDNLTYSQLDSGFIRIDTPFYDGSGQQIILYANKNEDDILTLTDGGYTLDMLETYSGFSITKSRAKKDILTKQMNAYGINYDSKDNFLSIETNGSEFPSAKSQLIQAMLFASDMFMLSDNSVKTIFQDDVAAFLEENEIRALRNFSYSGSTGTLHKFDFSIAGFKNIPDKLVKTISTPNNDTYAKALITDVSFTREGYERNADFFAFLNDQKKDVNKNVIKLLEYENIKCVPFSERDSVIEALKA